VKPLALYQWSDPRLRGENLGDALSAWILAREFGQRSRIVGPADADLLAIGSILEHLAIPRAVPRRRLGSGFGLLRRPAHIWGSGFLLAGSRFRSHRPVRVHAVRGPLSRRKIGSAASGAALGDPGLLVGRHLPRRHAAHRCVVLVPHYVDLGRALRIAEARPGELRVVDVLDPLPVVLEQLAGAGIILSSSLHGLVVADALGLPSTWVRFGPWPSRSRFKFVDYFLGTGGPGRPCFETSDRSGVERAAAGARVWLAADRLARIQEDLVRSFPFRTRIARNR
jgi:hypothetical protein